jgi:hypothetical protein
MSAIVIILAGLSAIVLGVLIMVARDSRRQQRLADEAFRNVEGERP